jgi:hypothetical protein
VQHADRQGYLITRAVRQTRTSWRSLKIIGERSGPHLAVRLPGRGMWSADVRTSGSGVWSVIVRTDGVVVIVVINLGARAGGMH